MMASFLVGAGIAIGKAVAKQIFNPNLHADWEIRRDRAFVPTNEDSPFECRLV